MTKAALILCSLGLGACAHAQFVYPKDDEHAHPKSLYQEDPFITHYRKEFFAVFQGDFPRFQKAYKEIEAMVAKNPNDARALIWLGNGKTVKAGILRNKPKEAAALLEDSRKTMAHAVALRPKDPNIYMMEAATLYIQGQYWPAASLPKSVWATLRDDCKRFIAFLGPQVKQVSVHVRGETYGELGMAYENLGDKLSAANAFKQVIALDPNTAYATRAKKELSLLATKG